MFWCSLVRAPGTSLSQHCSPPRHRGGFSLLMVLGSFWSVAVATVTSNLPCGSAHFGTPLRHSPCVALSSTTPLPHSPRLCCIHRSVPGIAHIRIQTASYKIPWCCSLPIPLWDPCSGPLFDGQCPSEGTINSFPRMSAFHPRDFPPLQHKGCWTRDEGVMMSLKASLMYFSASLRHMLSQRIKVCLQW